MCWSKFFLVDLQRRAEFHSRRQRQQSNKHFVKSSEYKPIIIAVM